MPLNLEGEELHPPVLGWWVPVRDRFFTRIIREDMGHGSDCWLWKNKTKRADVFVVDGVNWLPYRWAYTEFVGPIPDGLTIDHLCRQPACCRPEHLEPVTLAENVRREHEARRAAKTLCVKGLHPWPESAVAYGTQGRTYCGPCRKTRELDKRRT